MGHTGGLAPLQPLGLHRLNHHPGIGNPVGIGANLETRIGEVASEEVLIRRQLANMGVVFNVQHELAGCGLPRRVHAIS